MLCEDEVPQMGSGAKMEQQKENLIFTRPLMPYGMWDAKSKDTHENSLTIATVHTLPHWIPTLEEPVCPRSNLQALINMLSPLCSPIKSSRDEELLSDVNIMLNETLDQLQKERRLFNNSILIPTGSIVENTKVGKPRELDFLLVLPFLHEQQLFIPCNFVNVHGMAKVRKNIISDILKDWDTHQTYPKEETGKQDETACNRIDDVRVAIANVFRIYFLQNLLPNWSLTYPSVAYSDASYKVSIATQFSLINTTDNVNIKVDICFCVPLNFSTLKESFDEDETDFHFRYFAGLSQTYSLYGIIGSVASYYTKDEYDMVAFRVTVPELEQSLFERDTTGTRSRCYRLAKCISSKFFPEKWIPKLGCTLCECPQLLKTMGLQDQSCEMCWHTLISSFTFKTIIFYMSHIYPDDIYWTDENLGNRLIELCLILHQSYEKDYNRYRISAFYLPEVILLDNAVSKRIEDRPEFNLNLENFSLSGMEKTSYEYGKVFPVDDFTYELKDIVGQYISYVRSQEWSLRELICRLKDVLLELKQTTDSSGMSVPGRQSQTVQGE